MLNFQSFGQLAVHLQSQAIRDYKINMRKSLKEVGEVVSAEARKSVGVYQSGIGPFPAWAGLADSTIERKSRSGLGMGGNPNTPLYATGRFKQSIAYKAENQSVTIGTNVPYIVHTEVGTSKMPPRPVFGPAALRALPRLLPCIAAAGACAVAGRSYRAESFTSKTGTTWKGEVK